MAHRRERGDVTLFMAAKIVGTVVVLTAFVVLLRFRRTWGVSVATSVAVFQIWLFCYLTWADPYLHDPSNFPDRSAEEAQIFPSMPPELSLDSQPWQVPPESGGSGGRDLGLTDVQRLQPLQPTEMTQSFVADPRAAEVELWHVAQRSEMREPRAATKVGVPEDELRQALRVGQTR